MTLSEFIALAENFATTIFSVKLMHDCISKKEGEEAEEEDLVLLNQLEVKHEPIISSNFWLKTLKMALI